MVPKVSTATIEPQGQLSIPSNIREAAHLKEVDEVSLEVVQDGIVIHQIESDQAGFWTPEWQAREREADEDVAASRFTRYENDEEFLAALDERMKPLDADA